MLISGHAFLNLSVHVIPLDVIFKCEFEESNVKVRQQKRSTYAH